MTGKGSTYRPAERAILVLEVFASNLDDAKEASEIVTAVTKDIRELIEPYCPNDNTSEARESAAIAHYSMSSLQTDHYTQQRRDPNTASGSDVKVYETVYSAKALFNIKFSDFSVLGKLATQFSAMDDVNIKNISWKLTEENELSIHSETRRKAAKDVLQRAHDYAIAIGGVSEADVKDRVKAVWLRENDRYTASTRPHLHRDKRVMMYGGVKEEEIAFQPEDVSLEVSVEGKFVVE